MSAPRCKCRAHPNLVAVNLVAVVALAAFVVAVFTIRRPSYVHVVILAVMGICNLVSEWYCILHDERCPALQGRTP